MGKQFGRNAAGTALSLGMTAAGALAVPATKYIMGAITKRQDYNEMMGLNPDLPQIKQENPRMFNQMYTSLRNANPEFGRDPIIAGAHMRKMMNTPPMAGFTLVEAMRARPNSSMEVNMQTPRDYLPLRTSTKF